MRRRVTFKDRAALALAVALCANGCSFATLGRVTENGRDADSSKLSQIAIERAGRVVPAASNMSLEKGDTIATGPDVSVSISFAGANVLLMPNTKVTLGSIWTWFGEVFVSGWLTSDSKLATAGVEGTEYVFKVDPETSETTITVLEGKVRATSKTASWPVRELTRAQQLRIAESDTARPEPVTLDRDAFNALLAVSNRGRTDFQDSLVPDVQGLARDEAERQLKGLELRVSTRTTPVTDDAQIDRVISQKPEAGVRSRNVELRIGVRAVLVPDLSGISLDEARTRIEGAGLRVGRVRTKDAGQDLMPGTLLSQDPRAGTAVTRDSKVELVVQADASSAAPEASSAAPEASSAAPTDRVPHVIGLAPEAAVASLAAAGLQAAVHETLEAGRTSAVVMDQNPASDSPKPASGTVDLKVSLPGVQVPDLIYVPASEIDARVADKGLTIQRSERWVPEGTARDQSVSSQSRPAGQLVPLGTVLSVVIDRVITTCVVPDVSSVVGGYETEAEVRSRVEAAIHDAGMPAEVTIVPGTGDSDMWIIRRQSPKPGQQVDCRTPVVVQITRILG
jgi:beta-lactam-binding protein with PASTA domain